MFDLEINRDPHSKNVTRRVFLAGSAAAAAGLAVSSLYRAPLVEAGGGNKPPGEVTIVNFSDDGQNLGKQKVPKIAMTNAEWRQQLGANSFRVARQGDTEIPFSGVTWQEHGHGLYRCICCDTALFSSQTKFESGTGWPSFWAPLAKENIVEESDDSMGMERTEIKCRRCEGHLGHVFDDGPQPTGLRYCMNSASMRFVKI